MKENIVVRILFREDVKQDDMLAMEKRFKAQPFVKSARFISKEEGLRQWQKDYSDDASKMLGFNPLPNTIDIYFKEGYMQPDSLNRLKVLLEKNDANVREVYYQEALVQQIDKITSTIGAVLLAMSLIMGIISIILIHNTIRLTLYARRFLIKSMQLVGATQGFIRGPFITRGILMGLLSGILAIGCIGLLIFMLLRSYNLSEVPELMQDNFQTAVLFFSVILLGILISGLSSYYAINKYLKMKLDDLF
jgi:cell division transport system permease protein